MSRRNAILGGYPLGFEKGEFDEAHENRVERAGLKSRLAAQLVAVVPGHPATNLHSDRLWPPALTQLLT